MIIYEDGEEGEERHVSCYFYEETVKIIAVIGHVSGEALNLFFFHCISRLGMENVFHQTTSYKESKEH